MKENEMLKAKLITELDRLNARLKNTEKALLALAAVLHQSQGPEVARYIDIIMREYEK